MLKPRNLLLFFFLLLSLTWLSFSNVWNKTTAPAIIKMPSPHQLADLSSEKMKMQAANARTFASANGYNEVICLLVDMSLASGQTRFFVYDLKKDTIQNSGLVTHGRCNQDWLEGRKYGNTVGCGCTSLGKYKIGRPYNGKFGLAYKLHGLDSTNNKAFERFVVLHSHECVPETEVSNEICQSDGCPTVAPGFLKYLKPIINSSTKPVLLWIY